MSDGAELSLLEVKTLSNFHWLCPNKCLAGNAAIGELKVIARTDSTWKI